MTLFISLRLGLSFISESQINYYLMFFSFQTLEYPPFLSKFPLSRDETFPSLRWALRISLFLILIEFILSGGRSTFEPGYWSWYLQFPGILLERPKSQSLTLQSDIIKIFAGLTSLWMILQRCRKAIAHKQLYTILSIWCSLKSILCFKSWSKSVSIYSMTKQI